MLSPKQNSASMMKNKFLKYLHFASYVLAVILIESCTSSGEKIDFSTQIKPILNNKCITCHGGVKKNAGFSVLFENEAFADTESGKPAIIPGNASGSELIKRINEDEPKYSSRPSVFHVLQHGSRLGDP